jgi:predicted GNAT family acetyltransferase
MRHTYADVDHWATVHLFHCTPLSENKYIVSGWEINRKYRGQGYASKLFDLMLADADKEKATLMLAVEPDGTGLDELALFAFYESRGFKRLHENSFTMVRKSHA